MKSDEQEVYDSLYGAKNIVQTATSGKICMEYILYCSGCKFIDDTTEFIESFRKKMVKAHMDEKKILHLQERLAWNILVVM